MFSFSSTPFNCPTFSTSHLSLERKNKKSVRKLRKESHPEAAVVATKVGIVADPTRHAAVLRIVVPTATAQHPVEAVCRTRGVGLRITAVISVPVAAPLPHVSAHIVKS